MQQLVALKVALDKSTLLSCISSQRAALFRHCCAASVQQGDLSEQYGPSHSF